MSSVHILDSTPPEHDAFHTTNTGVLQDGTSLGSVLTAVPIQAAVDESSLASRLKIHTSDLLHPDAESCYKEASNRRDALVQDLNMKRAASKFETDELYAKISRLQKQISEVKASSEKDLEGIQAETEELTEALVSHRVAVFAQTAPPEILREIFLEYRGLTFKVDQRCISKVDNGPWILGHVCRRWRYIAMNHPVLWSRVSVSLWPYQEGAESDHGGNYFSALVSKIEEGFRRSGSVRLTVWIMITVNDLRGRIFRSDNSMPHELVLRVLTLIFSTASRWTEAHLEVPMQIDTILRLIEAKQMPVNNPLHSLKKLSFRSFVDGGVWYESIPSSLGGLSSITSLELHRIFLPEDFNPSWNCLSKLCLDDCAYNPEALQHLLKMLPELSDLSIDTLMLYPSQPGADLTPVAKIEHSRLTKLTLKFPSHDDPRAYPSFKEALEHLPFYFPSLYNLCVHSDSRFSDEIVDPLLDFFTRSQCQLKAFTFGSEAYQADMPVLFELLQLDAFGYLEELHLEIEQWSDFDPDNDGAHEDVCNSLRVVDSSPRLPYLKVFSVQGGNNLCRYHQSHDQWPNVRSHEVQNIESAAAHKYSSIVLPQIRFIGKPLYDMLMSRTSEKKRGSDKHR